MIQVTAIRSSLQ